jgi:two-component system response regulator RegX3
MRVALLEDDPSQAELLGDWLASAGHRCILHERGQTLVHALRQESFDVLVLAWPLPDINGVDVLKQVRSALQSPVPVLLISARANEADIVTALNQGADDYMVKPVRRLELLARLEAITRRRASEPGQPQVIELGALRLDCQTRTAWRDGRPIPMTAKDFDLSVLFLVNVGRLLSRGELREAVWGRRAAVSSRTLDTHICRIRDKLGLTPSSGWRLTAVYRHGYRLQEAVPSAPQVDGQAAAMSGSL